MNKLAACIFCMPGISMFVMVVPDIMHDILEGALQYEVKLMLKNMIEVN